MPVGEGQLHGTIASIEWYGSVLSVSVTLDAMPNEPVLISAQRGHHRLPEKGSRVSLRFEADDVVLVRLASDTVTSDAELEAQFAKHARAAKKRRERAANRHLLFILVVVLGPLVIYPLARLVMLSRCARFHDAALHGVLRQSGNARLDRHDARHSVRQRHACVDPGRRGRIDAVFLRPFAGVKLVMRFLELFVAFPSYFWWRSR